MGRARIRALVVVAALASGALADNFIEEWNNVDPNAYEIQQQAATIRILTGSTRIFKFEAYDDATGDPGYINVCTTGGVMTRLNGQPIFPLDLTTYAGEPIPSLASADAALHARLLTSIS